MSTRTTADGMPNEDHTTARRRKQNDGAQSAKARDKTKDNANAGENTDGTRRVNDGSIPTKEATGNQNDGKSGAKNECRTMNGANTDGNTNGQTTDKRGHCTARGAGATMDGRGIT